MPVELGTSWQYSSCGPVDWPPSSLLGNLAPPQQAIALIVAQATFPQTTPIVGSRFSNRAHYNEFVESGSESWTLIRRWLVLRGEKRIESNGPRSQGEGTPHSRIRIPSSSRIPRASLLFPGPPSPRPLYFCEISVVIYPTPPFIFFLHLSVIHAHTRVHVPSVTFSGSLWATVAPIALSRGYIYLHGVRVLAVSI